MASAASEQAKTFASELESVARRNPLGAIAGAVLFGVLIGLGAGTLLLAYRNPFLHLMRKLTGWELFPASIYQFSELPALIVPRDIIVICGGSFIICLLAAAFPAWHASRLKPVEALRHE